MVIHSQMASDDQLRRLKNLGAIPTLFARHIEVWGDRHNACYLGPESTARLDPADSCVRLGIPFGLHVDTPVLLQPLPAAGSSSPYRRIWEKYMSFLRIARCRKTPSRRRQQGKKKDVF